MEDSQGLGLRAHLEMAAAEMFCHLSKKPFYSSPLFSEDLRKWLRALIEVKYIYF